MAVNLLGIAQAGQSLVGDLGEQLFRDDQRRQQNQVQALKLKQAQDTQTRQVAFRTEVQAAIQSGDPRAIGRLMALYPEFADQIKPGWEALSADARRANLTQTGIIYKRAMNGDAKGAAAMLRQRYEADLAAGQNDETTKEILDALEGGDPQEIKVAIGSLGMMIAADDPSKFGDVYGKLNPTESDAWQRKYDFIKGKYGQKAADQFAAGEYDPMMTVAGRNGMTIAPRSYFMGDAPATSDGPTLAQTTPRGPSDVGGVGDAMSDELNRRGGDQSTGMGGVPAPALGPNGMPSSLTPQQYQAIVDKKGKAETDAWAARNGVTVQSAQTPVRVRSIQEARKLPSGTTFITPDGRTMRKP